MSKIIVPFSAVPGICCYILHHLESSPSVFPADSGESGLIYAALTHSGISTMGAFKAKWKSLCKKCHRAATGNKN